MDDREILVSAAEHTIEIETGATAGVRTDGDGDQETGSGADTAEEATLREGVEEPEHLTHITTDDWKRIQEFAATEEDDRTPDLLLPDEDPAGTRTHSGATNPVTGERCRRIRRRMRDATTVREVVAELRKLHRSEIFRHAYGDCGHDHETPPTASPQLRRCECHAMRASFAEGATVSEIADEWFRAENTVTRHVFGRCSHDRTPRPLSPSDVSCDEVTRIRRMLRENEQVGVEEVAAALRLRPEVVATVLSLATRDHDRNGADLEHGNG